MNAGITAFVYNAVKSSLFGGTVEILAEEMGEQGVITVCAQGDGADKKRSGKNRCGSLAKLNWG